MYTFKVYSCVNGAQVYSSRPNSSLRCGVSVICADQVICHCQQMSGEAPPIIVRTQPNTAQTQPTRAATVHVFCTSCFSPHPILELEGRKREKMSLELRDTLEHKTDARTCYLNIHCGELIHSDVSTLASVVSCDYIADFTVIYLS